MRKIKIMSDSTCDLSPELLQKYNIDILPLFIVMDDQSYRDGLEITPDEIYKWSDANNKTPGTAAVSMEDALNAVKPFDQEDTDIIVFTISAKMSSTYNVLNLISDELEHANMYVIDSMNLSTGIGLQVLRAAELSSSGMDAVDIVDKINKARDKVRASFVVDTLIYLQRGGRCNAVTALLASALKLKPEIVVENGAMGVSKKFRGSIKLVTKNYAKELEPQLLQADPKRVFITHSGSSDEIISMVHKYLESLHYFDEILITRAGGVISSHCGPDTLGILFYMK